MIKIAAIVGIVAVVAIAAVLYLQSNSKDVDYEMAQIDVSPKIDLRESASSLVTDISSEEEKLLTDLIPPTPVPEDARPTETAVASQEPGQEELRTKTMDWKYRSFIMVGTDKSGWVEKIASSEMVQVKEGFVLDDVKFDALSQEGCVISLGSATMTMPLEVKADPPTRPAPPSYEEQKERFRRYKDNIMPTFQYLYSQYTPGPNQIIRTTPPSKEEIETAVANYYATMEPTIAASTKVSLPQEGSFPAATPDVPEGADQPPSESVSDEQMRNFVNQHLQGTPAPGPNTIPGQ